MAKGFPKVIKLVNRRTGVIRSYKLDKSKKALRPGKRISRNKRVYYEYRRNRSDYPQFL